MGLSCLNSVTAHLLVKNQNINRFISASDTNKNFMHLNTCLQKYKSRNATDDVKKIARFVQDNCEKVGNRYGKSAQQNRLTLNMLVEIFLGKKSHGIPLS